MPKCDRCLCEMELVEKNETCEVYACLYCDIIPSLVDSSIAIAAKPKPYINHCWKCKSGIDSRVCKRSAIPNNGYHCNNCGVDLAGATINVFA